MGVLCSWDPRETAQRAHVLRRHWSFVIVVGMEYSCVIENQFFANEGLTFYLVVRHRHGYKTYCVDLEKERLIYEKDLFCLKCYRSLH